MGIFGEQTYLLAGKEALKKKTTAPNRGVGEIPTQEVCDLQGLSSLAARLQGLLGPVLLRGRVPLLIFVDIVRV